MKYVIEKTDYLKWDMIKHFFGKEDVIPMCPILLPGLFVPNDAGTLVKYKL
ncbi:MAG: hypothetical protein ACXVHN_02725 [Methanobacterium sp.]